MKLQSQCTIAHITMQVQREIPYHTMQVQPEVSYNTMQVHVSERFLAAIKACKYVKRNCNRSAELLLRRDLLESHKRRAREA